jgi:hypothetical protein
VNVYKKVLYRNCEMIDMMPFRLFQAVEYGKCCKIRDDTLQHTHTDIRAERQA